MRTALDRAAARIDGKFDRQPEVEAAIRDTIGKTYEDLAQYAESQKQLERALELERRTWGPENPKTLNTLNHLGRTLWHQGKYQEAGALFGPALEIERRVLGPEHPDTLYCGPTSQYQSGNVRVSGSNCATNGTRLIIYGLPASLEFKKLSLHRLFRSRT